MDQKKKREKKKVHMSEGKETLENSKKKSH